MEPRPYDRQGRGNYRRSIGHRTGNRARFRTKGARVVIGDIDLAGAKETVASIKEAGGEADCLQVDVTKSTDVQGMVRSAVDRYGGLDFAFNNAGLVGPVVGVVDTAEDDWNQVVATNLTGVWLCMKYEIPEMLKRGGARS